MIPADLPAVWRTKAAELRTIGAEEQARAIEWAADSLEEKWASWRDEALTLADAVKESGYTYSSLQQKVAAGDIPNVGDRGRPRVLRRDLPIKTRRRRFTLRPGEPDLAEAVLEGLRESI